MVLPPPSGMVAYNAHVGDVHWRQLSMLRQFEIVFVYLGGYLDEQIPDTLAGPSAEHGVWESEPS